MFPKGPIYRESKSINWKHSFRILMDSDEEYAKQWTRREKGDLDNLSEWVKSVRFLRQIWIKQNLMGLWALFLHQSLKTQMFAKHLFILHDKYVVVPANKAHHNIVLCVIHITQTAWQRVFTWQPTTLTKEEILDNHRSVLCSFVISTKDEELDLPSLYWIPELHMCPYKQRYSAGAAKWSMKPLSKSLTYILSAVKTVTVARGGMNQIWILKNSKDMLEYMQSMSLSSCN